MNFNLIFSGVLAGTNMLLYGMKKYPISLFSNAWRSLIIGLMNMVTSVSKQNIESVSISAASLSAWAYGGPRSFLVFLMPFLLIPFIVNSNIMYRITNVLTFGNTRNKDGSVTLFGKALHSLVVGLAGGAIQINMDFLKR